MKTFWTIILGLFLLVGCNNSSTSMLGNWVKLSDFGGKPRGGAVGFVIGDNAYVGLGYNSDYLSGDPDITKEGYKKDFWMYNSTKDSWTKIASFPGVGRVNAVAFAVNGKGYVGTGYDGEVKLADFWEYDPATDQWTRKDDFPGVARYKAVGFAIDNFGYVGTGYGADSSDQNDFYKFNPAAASGSQWTLSSPIKGSKRRGATAFVYNKKAYVCTGSHNNEKLTDMYAYDPSDDSWTKKVMLNYNSDWTITRENASSFVFDTKAYVFLGYGSSNLQTCWEYDFAGDTWVEKSKFEGAAREFGIGLTLGNGKAIVTTGQSGSSYFDDVWEWRPYEESNTED